MTPDELASTELLALENAHALLADALERRAKALTRQAEQHRGIVAALNKVRHPLCDLGNLEQLERLMVRARGQAYDVREPELYLDGGEPRF
jgi:hypothetical protein